VTTIDEHVAITEICQLKHAYAWSYDSRDLEALVELFCADATCDFGPYGSWAGTDEIREGYAATMARMEGRFPGIHSVTNPLIEVDLQQGTATGRWYLLDLFFAEPREPSLRIIAVYHETYRQEPGRGWRIASCRIEFLWSHERGRISPTGAEKERSVPA
jgi:hypothetical protein